MHSSLLKLYIFKAWGAYPKNKRRRDMGIYNFPLSIFDQSIKFEESRI